MKEKIKNYIEKEMEKKDLKYLSDKKEIINNLYNEFCKNCLLKDQCNICNTVKEEINKKIKEKIGENNL